MHCPVYASFLHHLGVESRQINQSWEIPFLPISFFKTTTVVANGFYPQLTFISSSTTGTGLSHHYVADPHLYRQSFLSGFRQVYGNEKKYCFLALLPGYRERTNSSLVHMAVGLMEESGHPMNGFYLDDFGSLNETLKATEAAGQPVILLGVAHALLHFGKQYQQQLHHTILVETGGMKGRFPEMTKAELHQQLTVLFGVGRVHSEYGMTELLSQAYSTANGLYQCPAWMQVRQRDVNDPLHVQAAGRGGLNVIDLANRYSCSFIATDDAAIVHNPHSFEVLGRLDHSDIRGCSLLYA